MQLQEAISLIQTEEFRDTASKIWADLGCGSGLFTRALSALLSPASTIYAIDRDISSFDPGTPANPINIRPIQTDFTTTPLELINLNGILMANSLHFVSDKKEFLKNARSWFAIRPLYLIVEYDTDIPNRWVPYPVSFQRLEKLFADEGPVVIKKIGTKKSLYHAGILYSAVIRYSPV